MPSRLQSTSSFFISLPFGRRSSAPMTSHPSPLWGEGRVRGPHDAAPVAPSPSPLPRWGRGMRRSRMCRAGWITVAMLLIVGSVLPARAQEVPRQGGELVFVVPAEPPSYDAHREETFAMVHPAAPHYSTLLRVDPFNRGGTRIVGDLAESWAPSRDGRTYTFTLRRGVRFHDGSELTARDVKASYDKIIFPPPGIASNRKGEYIVVEAVEAPDSLTVVFRLR